MRMYSSASSVVANLDTESGLGTRDSGFDRGMPQYSDSQNSAWKTSSFSVWRSPEPEQSRASVKSQVPNPQSRAQSLLCGDLREPLCR